MRKSRFFSKINTPHIYMMRGEFSQWGQQLTALVKRENNVFPEVVLTTQPIMPSGARNSVTAHGLHRPTQERPVADSPSAAPTQRWCSDWGKERANVTGKSARAVGLHPSWALGLDSTEAASRWSRRTSSSHPAEPMEQRIR